MGSVGGGGEGVGAGEELGVVAGVAEAAGEGDFGDGEVGGGKEAGADLEAVGVEEAVGGLVEVAAEYFAAFASADVSGGGDVGEGEFFGVVLADVGNHVFLELNILVYGFFDREAVEDFFCVKLCPEGVEEGGGLEFVAGGGFCFQAGEVCYGVKEGEV